MAPIEAVITPLSQPPGDATRERQSSRRVAARSALLTNRRHGPSVSDQNGLLQLGPDAQLIRIREPTEG